MFRYIVTKKDIAIAGFMEYTDAVLFFNIIRKDKKQNSFYIKIAILELNKYQKYEEIESYIDKDKV